MNVRYFSEKTVKWSNMMLKAGGKEWSQFQQIVHEDAVVAFDIYTVKVINNFANDAFVRMTTDECVWENIIER